MTVNGHKNWQTYNAILQIDNDVLYYERLQSKVKFAYQNGMDAEQFATLLMVAFPAFDNTDIDWVEIAEGELEAYTTWMESKANLEPQKSRAELLAEMDAQITIVRPMLSKSGKALLEVAGTDLNDAEGYYEPDPTPIDDPLSLWCLVVLRKGMGMFAASVHLTHSEATQAFAELRPFPNESYTIMSVGDAVNASVIFNKETR